MLRIFLISNNLISDKTKCYRTTHLQPKGGQHGNLVIFIFNFVQLSTIVNTCFIYTKLTFSKKSPDLQSGPRILSSMMLSEHSARLFASPSLLWSLVSLIICRSVRLWQTSVPVRFAPAPCSLRMSLSILTENSPKTFVVRIFGSGLILQTFNIIYYLKIIVIVVLLLFEKIIATIHKKGLNFTSTNPYESYVTEIKYLH